ncbi:MAG TPA: carboxyl transferase domain-containing protein [Mycobacteriales bacterium]|nr:carboxyl transferase domain-containing protein [Mycobacteriales bacterium]
MSDWRDAVLVGVRPLFGAEAATAADDAGDPTAAPSAVWAGHGRIGRADVVVAAWDFTVRGGSFGDAEATVFTAACAEAAATRRPLVSLLRSGGTRLQEGMRALVGIPRAMLALQQVAAAGVPHVAVADQPTTGGVWVAVGSTADIRAGVAGATVGFSGPRVIEAMTGVAVPRGTNTAESALTAGLLDVVLAPEQLATWLEQVLLTLRPDDPRDTAQPPPVAVPDRSAWEQVQLSRSVERPSGSELVDDLLGTDRDTDDGDDGMPVWLRGADDSVAVAIGRLDGRRVVAVALTGRRAGRASPAGYELLARAARLADRLDLACIVLVDTAGADPLPVSEQAGIAPAIAAATDTLLRCGAPTIAVVHGEGGSGGALAGAVTDCVAVGDLGWFAALGPEGAAATLRVTPAEAADLLGLAPRDLLASGFADALAPADERALREWLAARLDGLRAQPREERLARRRRRWSSALPGSSGNVPGGDPDIA